MVTKALPTSVENRANPIVPAPSVREHFIPIRRSDLVDLICSQLALSGAEQQAIRSLEKAVIARFHAEYHQQLETLKDAYAPFDPDRDTESIAHIEPASRDALLPKLFESFVFLLARGNFYRLGERDIEQALQACSHWGLNLDVDFSAFERIEIYARGHRTGVRERRRRRVWMPPEQVPVPVYQRLIVIFKLRVTQRFGRYSDADKVYIKLFKDIPTMDLEMLLPGTRVRMTLIDRARILLPTVSGIVIAVSKLIKGAMLAAAIGFYGFLALIGGTVGYGVKSILGYQRTKQKYQLSLTESLYFQNLDNNAGVLHRLLDEAEEQEEREALLAYALLRHRAPADGWTAAELDTAAEEFLSALVPYDVDFEVGDALEKLLRVGLVGCRGERYHAFAEASASLGSNG